MTNREWMESLSDDDFAAFLTFDLYIDKYDMYISIDGVKRMFTQSQIGVREWLSQPCQWIKNDET